MACRPLLAEDRPGYVVTLQGDTIRGQIRLVEKVTNPTSVVLLSADGKTLNFSPADIKAFGTAQGMYESWAVSRNSSPPATSGMQAGRNNESPRPVLSTENLFLRVVFSGPVSLLEFIDSSGRLNLYVRKEKSPDYLMYHQYYVRELGAVASTREYLSQLRALLGDCAALIVPDLLAYNTREISLLLKKYARCTGSSFETPARPRSSSHIGLTGGSHTALVRTNDTSYPMVYGGGLVLLTDFPWRDNRWSAATEIALRRYAYDHTTIVGLGLIPRYKFAGSRFFINTGAYLGRSTVAGRSALYASWIGGAGTILGQSGNFPVYVDFRIQYGFDGYFDNTRSSVLSLGFSVAVPLVKI